ncbi:glycoside hydrolase [Nitrosomonas sp.]|uniref:glycoside hydrolase n=1 Tax=Nitrosomonas sp. TaxID=42353 RepID=UPI00374DA9A5
MEIISPIRYKDSTSLSLAKRSMQSILVAILFIISMIWIPFGTAQAVVNAPPGSVKWHPGHYYTLVGSGKNNPAYLEQVYSELNDTPALRGIQVRYSWVELEKSFGVYDFSFIEKRLSELAAQNKRLMILLELKSWGADTDLVPDYVINNPIYENGIFAFSRDGSSTITGNNIKLWNPMVRDRLAALISELGKRFNSHEYFEGIGLTETSLGFPIKPLTSTQKDDYYSNLLAVNKKMRASFPNTMTFQFANHPRSFLPLLVGELKGMGSALGCPDVFIEDPGLNFLGSKWSPQGIYPYYPENSGLMPLVIQVEGSNYENTRWDNTGYQPTVSELLNFARYQLKVNYIFWVRDLDHYPKVLEVLSWSKQNSTPSGGLRSACPENYTTCID